MRVKLIEDCELPRLSVQPDTIAEQCLLREYWAQHSEQELIDADIIVNLTLYEEEKQELQI